MFKARMKLNISSLDLGADVLAGVELLHQLAHDEDPNVRTAALNTIRLRKPATPNANWED